MYNQGMNSQPPITSPQNSQIQLVRKLLNQPKARQKEGAFVAEGARLLEDGLKSEFAVRAILRKEHPSPRALKFLAQIDPNLPITSVQDKLFESLSDTDNPQGVLAVFEFRTLPLPQKPSFLVVLDQLRDPGNMGTILRSAEAAGVEGVLLPVGNTDPFAPKVVRAGMGAHFRLPILQLPWDGISSLTQGLKVFHADMDGAQSCWKADFRSPLALLIGGEAAGISPEGRRLVTGSVRIPMRGQTESLNAGVSASVLMFEVMRQRQQDQA